MNHRTLVVFALLALLIGTGGTAMAAGKPDVTIDARQYHLRSNPQGVQQLVTGIEQHWHAKEMRSVARCRSNYLWRDPDNLLVNVPAGGAALSALLFCIGSGGTALVVYGLLGAGLSGLDGYYNLDLAHYAILIQGTDSQGRERLISVQPVPKKFVEPVLSGIMEFLSRE
ncbi:MAG: hypothetical protein V1798_09700 [Pseudomonadota bacterium]